ncbi:hypothetical protein [Desulfurispira natronophila]|uniref:FlaG/FlaF family flagellin (Archaellin) n=1 Tax=Desulfurispira natronophila TaxID=682562 RepID=A0A7W7Y4D6_9BACT|nr:hypothetical protein [Desulfurispira natronophila]MBB5021817.1 FlaG/FlaF family flagellin (archaellin) [Desulfurispira natronophila]
MDTTALIKRTLVVLFLVVSALAVFGCGGSSSGSGSGGNGDEATPRDTVQLSGLVSTSGAGGGAGFISASGGFNGFVAALDVDGGLITVGTDAEGNYDFKGDDGLTRGQTYTIYIMDRGFSLLGVLRGVTGTGTLSLTESSYRVNLEVNPDEKKVTATAAADSPAIEVRDDEEEKFAVDEDTGEVVANQPTAELKTVSLLNFIGNSNTWSISYDRFTDSEWHEEERLFSVNMRDADGSRVQRESEYFVKDCNIDSEGREHCPYDYGFFDGNWYNDKNELASPAEVNGLDRWITTYDVIMRDGVQYLSIDDSDGEFLLPMNMVIGRSYTLRPEGDGVDVSISFAELNAEDNDDLWQELHFLSEELYEFTGEYIDLWGIADVDSSCLLTLKEDFKFTVRPNIVDTWRVAAGGSRDRPVLGLTGQGEFDFHFSITNCENSEHNVPAISESGSVGVGMYFVEHYGARASVLGSNASWGDVKDQLRFGAWREDGGSMVIEYHDGKQDGYIPGLSDQDKDLIEEWLGFTRTFGSYNW